MELLWTQSLKSIQIFQLRGNFLNSNPNLINTSHFYESEFITIFKVLKKLKYKI